MNKVTDVEMTAVKDSLVRLGWPIILNHSSVKYSVVPWNELE